MKKFIRILLDLLVILFSFWLAHIIKFGYKIPAENFFTYLLIIPFLLFISIIIYLFAGLYRERRVINLDIAGRFLLVNILQVLIILGLILFVNNYYGKSIPLSRLMIFIFYLVENLLIFLEKIVYEAISRLKKSTQNVLVMGVEKGHDYIKHIKRELSNVELYDFEKLSSKTGVDIEKHEQILTMIEQYGIKFILLMDLKPIMDILELVNRCKVLGVEILVSPEVFNTLSSRLKLKPMENSPFFQVMLEPVSGLDYIIKRSFDILVSFTFIIITLPLFPLIMLFVMIDSEGPPFFKQIRIGKNKKPFNIIKFRTMIKSAEQETGPKWTEENDKRITRVGKFLRHFSIDEIPQFYLVLIGKMSIVGPRPERPYFYELYPSLQGMRVSVKPGMSGLAQINGRYDLTVEEKLNYDMYYINNHSFFLDLEIFLKSIIIVFSQAGAR